MLFKTASELDHHDANLRPFFNCFQLSFDRMNAKYVKSLGFLARKWITVVGLHTGITILLFQPRPLDLFQMKIEELSRRFKYSRTTLEETKKDRQELDS
jgi:HAE1 family hydrophobic/amphiphilic exporter-1